MDTYGHRNTFYPSGSAHRWKETPVTGFNKPYWRIFFSNKQFLCQQERPTLLILHSQMPLTCFTPLFTARYPIITQFLTDYNSDLVKHQPRTYDRLKITFIFERADSQKMKKALQDAKLSWVVNNSKILKSSKDNIVKR